MKSDTPCLESVTFSVSFCTPEIKSPYFSDVFLQNNIGTHFALIEGDGRRKEKEKEMEQSTSWDAFQIAERNSGKHFWVRIGIAFLNRDNSINVILDALPKDGKLQLRLREPNPKQEEGGVV